MESDTEITDIMPACISFGLDEASFMFSFSLFLDLYLTWCKDISF